MIRFAPFFICLGFFALAGCSLPSMDAEISSLMQDKAAHERALKIAEISVKSGNYLAAIDIYQKLLEKNAEDKEVLYELGATYLKAGAALQAIPVFERLEEDVADVEDKDKDEDRDIRPLLGLARANLFLYRPDAAALYFDKCLTLDPVAIDALSGLAIAKDMAGEHLAARLLYVQALELAPENTGLRNNFALSYLMEGQYDAAIEYLSRLALGPDSSPVLRQNLALAYGLSGDEAAAERIARLDLDTATVENNLRFYALLRRMSDKDSLRRLLLGPRSDKPVAVQIPSVPT